jgi:hypothetical protein
MSLKPDTIIYINSKGRNTRSGKLSPAQLKFFKPMTQKQRGVWLNRLYNIENVKYFSNIYDENFKDPCAQSIECNGSNIVDIIQVIHESLKEVYAEV